MGTHTRTSAATDVLDAPEGKDPSPVRPRHLFVFLVLLGLAFVAFAPALHGAFVYDDTKQILDNPLLRSAKLEWTLFTTDVWGYKADKGQAWSDYWRPLFSLWLVLNSWLFGLDDTLGWHVTSIVLHAVTALVAYGTLLAMGVTWPMSGVIALVFAVHPCQVESVAWISGVPNILLAAPLLGSLWLFISERQTPRPWKRGAGLLLYSLALLTKEVAVLFGFVILVVPRELLVFCFS